MTYRPMTLIVPYYENDGMFREQQRQWLALPADTREALHVIVVDDGSPKSRAAKAVDAETAQALASFRLFRTKVDVRWNWIFCRNLGAEKATTEWILMTDMDHVIPNETWRRVMRGKLDTLRAYRLSRVVAPNHEAFHPHPNTWLMTRHMFRERIGGYDERFSGVYGSDGFFHSRVEEWAKAVELLPEVAVLYPDTVIADACTKTYQRKEASDHERKVQIRMQIRVLGDEYRPLGLTFPWEQVI